MAELHPAQLLFTQKHPLTSALNMQFEGVKEKTLTVTVDAPISFADSDRVHVHTGFNTLFLDTVMGSCAIGELKTPMPIATIKLTCNHLTRIRLGERVKCLATWDGEENEVAYIRGEIYAGPDNRLIAHAVGTFMLGTATSQPRSATGSST